ncbi:prolyl aminopeptidase [Mycoplasma crocodyli]|nr:prolyl aminopeptidase [Mycoplasma crocodyli]
MKPFVYEEGWLKVDDHHEIFYELSGNKKGVPVIFLHGGPGGSSSKNSKDFFNPKFYNIIVFDQRGCGKSKPIASTINNTTWDLIADIEKLRKMVKAEKLLVFGGSWGSTLALSYAIKHPDRVLGLILRGIFLGTKDEIHWLYQEGVDKFFPDVFDKYKNYLPLEKQQNILNSYHDLLTGLDEDKRLEAATHFSYLESNLVTLKQNNYHLKSNSNEILSISALETHYFVNNCFFVSDNWIMENLNKIKNVKTYIVHGRYDMVTLPKYAYSLHNSLNDSTLFIVGEAGHSASEKGILKRLKWCCNDIKKYLK